MARWSEIGIETFSKVRFMWFRGEKMKYQAFVISLERSESRLAHAREMLEQLPIEAEILPAVDGRALSDKEIEAIVQPARHQPNYPFEVDTGNIGCFLSHRKAWRQIVERGLDAALILEDDAHVDSSQLAQTFEFVSNNSPPGSYTQFPVRPLPTDSEGVVKSNQCRLVCPRVTPLRTSGQWVTRGAAEKLLSVTETIDRPIDTTLQMHWITGIKLLAVEPSGISDMTTDLGGSMIGENKERRSVLTTLSREVNRAWYRWQVARRSAA